MRILLIVILSVLVGLVQIQAQTKTYDIKYVPTLDDDPNDFGMFQQISPTRTLAFCGGSDSRFLFVALNSDGMIERRWKMPFIIHKPSFYYKYDSHSNTLVFLTNELISTAPLSKIRMHLVLLDSNLVEKSNVILDSSITGIPTEFDFRNKFQGISLLDSTILWMSYGATSPELGAKQIALFFSKDGQFIRKTSILDTSESFINVQYPLFQRHSGEIVFLSSKSNSKIKYFVNSLRTSDTTLHVSQKPSIDSLHSGIEAIQTRDGGVALAYYSGNQAIIIKYDKDFQKQWTTTVPGVSDNTPLYFLEGYNRGYYIATKGYDDDYIIQHPEFKNFPYCFQDIVLSRIDTSGKVLFNAYYGTGTCDEEPFDMMQDYTDGGIIISGTYNRPYYNSPCESLCNDGSTYWLFKVDSLGEPAKRIGVTGVEEKTGITNIIKLFPNPASGILSVDYGRTNYFTSIEIIDNRGTILQSSPLEAIASKTTIDISTIASGNYFCRLRSHSFFIARPFVIQR